MRIDLRLGGIACLNAVAQAILDEGMAKCFARHEQVANMCRNGLVEMGIKLFASSKAICSPTVTAAMVPAGFNFKSWQKALRAQGLITAGSLAQCWIKFFVWGTWAFKPTPS